MIRTAFLATALLAATPALAQDQGEEQEPPLIVSFGGGAQIQPQFPGSEELEVGPLFTGFVRREGDPIPFRTPDDGIGPSVIGRGPIEFGPLVQFQSKRDEEDVGAPVGDVDFTVEAGAFVNVNFGNFRIRAEALYGLGGHEALNGALAADVAIRGGNDTLFTIGPRLRLSDRKYMEAYFGVTPAAAAASGLPAYAPDGGIRAVGAVAGITHQLSRSVGVYGYAGYDRLIGDAADSPIVRLRGSPDQFSAGIALYFSFRIRSPF